MRVLTCQVAVIGAGPYGLAAAAHLRSAGVETCIFGESMEFWRKHMPIGMLLRSKWEASYISAPDNALTLDEYELARGMRLPRPVTLADFVEYGQWFQRQVAPDLDTRRVMRVERSSKGFRLLLEDGDQVDAYRVIVATGIGSFAYRPPAFSGLPPTLASHSSDHYDLRIFADRRVLVVGGGQSAIESAALLRESGADVELVMRGGQVRWLTGDVWWKSELNPLKGLMYPHHPVTDVGPPFLSHIIARPYLFKRLPLLWQQKAAYRSIRPAGARWLVPRVQRLRITTGRSVLSAKANQNHVGVMLNDGTERNVDHVLLATGYRVDICRHSFLAQELRALLASVDGYPELGRGFESSVPGLYFIGAPAAWSFGPLMRFVAGTPYTSRNLVHAILRADSRRLEGKRSWMLMTGPQRGA